MQVFEPARADVVDAVDKCAMFDGLAGAVRDELIEAFDGVRIATGEMLIHQGDRADALYLVRHGRLRTTMVDQHGDRRVLGEVGSGEVVGEMAVITDDVRSASVLAMRDSEVYRLSSDAFVDLTARHPEILRPFAGVVVARLRNTMMRPRDAAVPATVALVPAPGVDAEALAHRMIDSLDTLRGLVITGADAAGQTDTAAWLLQLENSTQLSLLVTDPDPTSWTRQCLRHADRILMVVEAGGPVGRTAIEADATCAERLRDVPTDLAVRYRTAPDASRWIRGRSFANHHNLARDDAGDIARMVRRLVGDMTVLVLGGGGARGFAHFGVIRALDEAGVAIDAIVGTSAGSLVGGLLARHGELDAWEARVMEWFADVRWRRDLTVPAVALTTGRFMTDGFLELFGDRRIEDLRHDYVAVSTDLTHAVPHLHIDGLLWQAVRASAAVPGIFPPISLDGRVLVDGGLVANLPVDIAVARHPGARIIAVDVGDPAGLDVGLLESDGTVGGFGALRRRRSFGPTLPRVLMRLTELGRNDRADGADLLIRPEVGAYGLIDTSAAPAIIAEGYRAAAAALTASGAR